MIVTDIQNSFAIWGRGGEVLGKLPLSAGLVAPFRSSFVIPDIVPVVAPVPRMNKARAKRTFVQEFRGFVLYLIIAAVIVQFAPRMLTSALDTSVPLATITSSSMWPVLKRGDLVLIQGVSAATGVKVGEIVVWTNDKGYTIHRVKTVKARENKVSVVTRGDANNVDDQPVAFDKVVGKMLTWPEPLPWAGKPVKIPYVGKVSMVIQGFRK